jgi:predicted phosphodiesterase
MRKTLVVGDIHGNFKYIWSKIKKIQDADIIFAGDVGIGFSNLKYYLEIFDYWNKKLEENNSKVYFIRGNHDNPNYWRVGALCFDNVIMVKDYETLKLGDNNIFCIGGAISIDRSSRNVDLDYWEDERVMFDTDKLNKAKDITHVITHTCPECAYPLEFNDFVRGWFDLDKTLEKDLIHERKRMQYVLDSIKENNDIKQWFYGHFHDSWSDMIYGINFKLLNINEISELK